MKFNRNMLLPADILAGRNLDPDAKQAKATRALLGSYTNHNALILHHSIRGKCIGDTASPRSHPVDLEHYEDLINAGLYEVRIWRVPGMTMEERQKVSDYWEHNCDGVPYPDIGVYRLWVFRIVNHLPWEIAGHWCTKNTVRSFGAALPPERDPRTRPDGKMKLNPTPRTMENRLVAGILKDVTPMVMVDI